jgi:NADPH-dependent 2,4-dienoyl-CoA reductase/sulfur reductase-like enzyme
MIELANEIAKHESDGAKNFQDAGAFRYLVLSRENGESMAGNEYDLVVIGSGPAGQKSAIAAAKMRKRVAVIQRGSGDGPAAATQIGGVCVHTGTIPSKTFRESVL